MLAAALGPILSVERPPQGLAFEVLIVSTPRGRFVLKKATTPSARGQLIDEVHVLDALRAEHPFVATPVGSALGADEATCAFTCIEGETMAAALEGADDGARHALVARFAHTLRRIHGWTPPLPRPDDWLTAAITHEHARMHVLPAGTRIAGTNTRFDGRDARQVAAALLEWWPGVANDVVFGHGDYCLPNVLVHEGEVVGVIDWSRGGYADRRFDLATALFTLRFNRGDDAAPYLETFLRAYGYREPLATLEQFEALLALTCVW